MFLYTSSCISPQHTFHDADLDNLVTGEKNILRAIEPKYEGIPLNILRRMGKAVRMGVGAALPVLEGANPDGIIIGTANGGMEDCIRFLNQIIQYDEGRLTPTNFVQSTPNAIAAQVGLTTANKGYNITHVHRGLAFENALLDAKMKVEENPESVFLLGGVDEISDYNYNIEFLGNWYKAEEVKGTVLYDSSTAGSVAGEGVAMFLAGGREQAGAVRVADLKMLHTDDPDAVRAELEKFVKKNSAEAPRFFLSGENGDSRHKVYYEAAEKILGKNVPVARFKHFTGEFPTASAIALWLAVRFLESGKIPEHFIKSGEVKSAPQSCLIYNHYKGKQHGFIWLTI